MLGKQANLSLIGSFVLGALALLIGSILFFGSGKIFAEKQKFVLYFQGTIGGLSVGAPVNFRGVRVGRVTDIFVHIDHDTMKVTTPVYIEIESHLIFNRHEPEKVIQQELSQILVQRGLRATLELESFVTGQLSVEFDFYPNTPVELRGMGIDEYPEIPTVPSGYEKLSESLQGLPIEELVQTAIEMMRSIEEVAGSPELKESIAAFRDTMVQSDKFLMQLNDMANEGSDFRYQLDEALQQFTEASRSVSLLADYIQQHPEALLYGKR